MVNANDVLNVFKAGNFSIDASSLDLNEKLSSQGVDSLDRTSFYFEIEERFNIKLPPEEESSYQSINDLVKYINAKK